MLKTRNIFFDVESSNKEELLKMICKKAVEYNISDDEQGLYQDREFDTSSTSSKLSHTQNACYI